MSMIQNAHHELRYISGRIHTIHEKIAKATPESQEQFTVFLDPCDHLNAILNSFELIIEGLEKLGGAK